MAASKKPLNANAMVLLAAPVVVVVGALIIFWSKGYFRAQAEHPLRKNETRFTKFAKESEQVGWQPEAPTALADGVRSRIASNVRQYPDRRFKSIQSEFQAMEQRHKSSQLTNVEYQQALLTLQSRLTDVEYSVDPERFSKRGKAE